MTANNTTLTVIPFDKDGTSGDSAFSVSLSFPYTEGMTLSDLNILANTYLMNEFWGVDEEYDVNEFIEEDGSAVVGGWVIDEQVKNMLDVEIMCGSDSACYAVTNCLKMVAQKAAKFVLK